MTFGTRRILGLAVEDGRTIVAELSLHAGRCVVTHADEFVFPADAGFADPLRLGMGRPFFLHGRHAQNLGVSHAEKAGALGVPDVILDDPDRPEALSHCW